MASNVPCCLASKQHIRITPPAGLPFCRRSFGNTHDPARRPTTVFIFNSKPLLYRHQSAAEREATVKMATSSQMLTKVKDTAPGQAVAASSHRPSSMGRSNAY